MRGRRFYGGGSGFLLCFAAERKHCAPESLFQLPPPSHTLLREKVAVRPIFCTVWHCALRCFPPEAQWRAPGSSRQFSLTTYTFLRGGGYAWPEGLRRRVWISALLCGRKETLCARKPVPIAAPVSHAFVGKGAVRPDFCTVWHSALRCFPPEAQCRAPGSSRQFSLQSHVLFGKSDPQRSIHT